MKYTFDCANIDGRRELHFELSKLLSFPEWYGNNLDALHDVLTDVMEDTELTIVNFNALEEKLGKYAQNFRHVLLDSAEENDHFTVTFE